MVKVVVNVALDDVAKVVHATMYEPIAVCKATGTLVYVMSQSQVDIFRGEFEENTKVNFTMHEEFSGEFHE